MMDFRDIWLGMTKPERLTLSERLGTSYKYLQKLAGGFGVPSLAFAQEMKNAMPDLDIEGFIRAKERAGKRAPSRVA